MLNGGIVKDWVEHAIKDSTHQWQVELVLSAHAQVQRYSLLDPRRKGIYYEGDSSKCVWQGLTWVRNDTQEMGEG